MKPFGFPQLFALACLVSGSAWAQSGTSVHAATKILGSTDVFYYSEENQQGGKDLPGGSTMFTAMSLQYNRADYYTGAGLFYHMDKVGETESHAAMGLKLEFFAPTQPYYVEFGYAFTAEQTFTNRAAQSRSGQMSYLGLGVRVSLTPWLYFDGSVKQRKWTFDQEDGVGLAEAITKTELVPFLGLGVAIPI